MEAWRSTSRAARLVLGVCGLIPAFWFDLFGFQVLSLVRVRAGVGPRLNPNFRMVLWAGPRY